MVKLQDDTENILFTEKPEIVPFSFGFETIDQGKFAQLTQFNRLPVPLRQK